MPSIQFGGPIGPFLDRVQQRGVPVTVSGTCEVDAGDDNEVRRRVVNAISTVIGAKMASGQLTFRNLGEGTIGEVGDEIIAQTGLPIGELMMRFAIDNGPPQREVRAKLRIGGFTIDASNKRGVDTNKLANQAIAKAKSAVMWWLIGGVLTLIIVGGTIWYVKRTVKKALNEPSASSVAAAKWDGKTPLACTGSDDITIKGVTAKLDATAVTASGGCKLTLVDVELTAPTAIEAGGNAVVTVNGGSITSTDLAVKAAGNAKVHLKKTKVSGKTQKLGGAEISGP